ncbi:hypothetical protein [Coxiella-like endosymbiont]|uniref:hypothetical protein n=1 Tax=Coxiella-like endosymbiont TaxID=1592897 RepID=UPI00272A88FD|nr:hypothetical protein [Coxiella-like endosymbiont]
MLLQQSPIFSATPSINYGVEEITQQVLDYGVPANKLQIEIAAYGCGFSGVERGSSSPIPALIKLGWGRRGS